MINKGTYDPRLSTYIVTLVPGTISPEQAPLLGIKYGFTVEQALSSSSAFSAELSPEALAQLRCDPLVVEIAYPGVVLPAS